MEDDTKNQIELAMKNHGVSQEKTDIEIMSPQSMRRLKHCEQPDISNIKGLNESSKLIGEQGLSDNTNLNPNPNPPGDFDFLLLDVEKAFLVKSNDFEGFKNDDIRDPETLQKAKEDVDARYPMKIDDKGKRTPFPVCSTHIGWIGWSEAHAKTDLSTLGVGMVVYLKVLKTFTLLFFIISVINIPLYYIYTTNHLEKKFSSYLEVFFKTTIGNVGSVLYNCQKIPIEKILSPYLSTYTVMLSCGNYNISSIASFGLTSNYDYTTNNTMQCQNFSSSMDIVTDKECRFEDILNKTATETNCYGKSQCMFNIDLSKIKSECTSSPKYDYFYLSYLCHDNWVMLGNTKISRDVFSFIVVSIDLGSVACVLICLMIIPLAQKRIQKHFKENVTQISDYTVHFKYLRLKQENIYAELNDFISHINNVYYHEFPQRKDDNIIIYDMIYPMITDSILDLVLEKNHVVEELKKLHYSLKGKRGELSEKKIEKIKYSEFKLKERDAILKKEIEMNDKKELKYVDDIYVTFTSIQLKNLYSRLYNRSMAERCCIIFCCQGKKINHLYFKDKWLTIQPITDQPSNIRWENMPYSTFKRRMRKFISFLLAILVLALPFGIVIGAKYGQIEINKRFNPDIDCSQITYTEEEVYREYKESSIEMRSKVLTHCFCFNNLLSQGYTNTSNYSFDISTFPCHTWINLYWQSKSLTVGIVILVPLVNMLLSLLLEALTNFERNKTFTLFLSSNMIKSFVLQLLNTGIIILLVNMRIPQVKQWDSNFPLFTGTFDDLTSSWYLVVGISIIFYMIINIVSPHVVVIGQFFYKKIQQIVDGSQAKRGKPTKCRTRKEYLETYMGADFNVATRYSEMLTTFFVILIYSSGMPILYVIGFFYFFLILWVDKWLILRFYKIPPKFDLYLARVFHVYIFLAIIIHLSFGIWIYGNKDILSSQGNTFLSLAADSVLNLFSFKEDSYQAYVLRRITVSHNLIMLAALGFCLMILIWRVLISKLFCRNCFSVNEEKIKNLNIYDGKLVNIIFTLALSTQNIYYNHQMRKALYKKMEKATTYESSEVHVLKETYFHKMLNADRNNIKRKIKEITEMDYTSVPNYDFDKVFPGVMKSLKAKLDKEAPVIRGDFTYNLSYNLEFRDIAYYVFILPFLNSNFNW